MFDIKKWDVVIIGAGPAGLASAVAAYDKGAKVCIIEREERPGGILKQCIHDGFGVVRFKEKLTGPEYAYRFIEMVKERGIPVFLNTFLINIRLQEQGRYRLTLINSRDAVSYFEADALILATGCRERTSRQIFLHGDRPAGVYTAGLAQYFINIQGCMPAKKCVILGSGDIGLIMARRLTLEGAEVEGVYEILPEPSGLARNISQCLKDYCIPLHLSTTVTKVHGKARVKGVTVAQVDGFTPISGTERYIECDSLILSVGLIPENDIIEPLDIEMDNRTKGPYVDQDMMTMRPGVFSCGNALHVNDLVDYVSESADIAGEMASQYVKEKHNDRKLIPIKPLGDMLYVVPQYLNLNSDNEAVIYFRSSKTIRKARLIMKAGDKELITKKFIAVKPPEMERVKLDMSEIPSDTEQITIELLSSES